MLKLQNAGKLSVPQQSCFLAPRPKWELFDLQRDPGELQNRFGDPAYATIRARLSAALDQWSKETGDYMPSRRTPDEFNRVTGEPDNSVRIRPRPSKLQMFGSNGKY